MAKKEEPCKDSKPVAPPEVPEKEQKDRIEPEQASELEALRSKYIETKDLLQRMQAEFDNYRKRQEKEHQRQKAFASSDIMMKLLPVLDSFEQALKSSDAEGIRMLYSQLMSQLESAGLRKIECIGKQFDPYIHEVLLKEPSDKEEGTVLEVLQTGYMLNSMILRHPKVKISATLPAPDKKEP